MTHLCHSIFNFAAMHRSFFKQTAWYCAAPNVRTAAHEAPRVHHAARRRGGGMAAHIAHEMKDLDAKQTMLQGIMFVLQ